MSLKDAKDKLYYYFAEKNWGVRREYGPYVETHREEHQSKRWKHWLLLIKLNWHYRVRRRKEYLIKINTLEKPQKKKRKEEKNNLKQQDLKNMRYRFVHGVWNTVGVTDDLLSTLKLYEQSRWSWENDKPEIFLIYISCLIEKGEYEEAQRVLKKYIANIGKKEIWKYMLVSKLFVEMGYYDFTIDKTSFVFNVLETNRSEDVLFNFLRGKSIAVVGNGSTEMGRQRGEEIDNHDIVIRFNNYQLAGFELDYGTKTSVWVRNANINTTDRDIIENVDLIVWEPDYWHMNLQHNHLDILYRDCRINDKKVVYLHGLRQEICSVSDVLNPTTGFQMVYYLEKYRENFKKVDYYGFSFLDDMSDASYEHYYGEATTARVIHQPDIEIDFMRKLVRSRYQVERKECLRRRDKIYKVYICKQQEDMYEDNINGFDKVLGILNDSFEKDSIQDVIQYLSATSKMNYSREQQIQLDSVIDEVNEIYRKAYYIQSNSEIKQDLDNDVIPILICFELGTAYGAFLSGLKYVYVVQNKDLNNANTFDTGEDDTELINKIEQRVVQNAVQVFQYVFGSII